MLCLIEESIVWIPFGTNRLKGWFVFLSKKKPPNCEGGGFEVNMIFDVFVWESGVARLLMLSILTRSGGVRKCEVR